MKTSFIAPIAATISATAASAGSLVYTAPVETMVVDDAPMGSSGAWIIPLIAIGLIALAISSSDSDDGGTLTTITTFSTL